MSDICKFAFTADTHLKPKTWASRPEIAGDTYHGFRSVIDSLCTTHKVPLVIGGDFFDCPKPDSYSVTFAIEQIARMKKAGLPVYYIDGNHDLSAPSWANIIGAESIHHKLVDINGAKVYGLPYTPKDQLADALQQVPAECDVLIMHQLLNLALPMEGMWNLDWGLIPKTVELVLLGDYHVNWTQSKDRTTFHYPGSTSMMSRSEKPHKTFTMIYGGDPKYSLHMQSLETRGYLALALETEAHLEVVLDILSTISLGVDVLDHPVGKLLHDQCVVGYPILDVSYNPDIPNVLNKLRTALGPEPKVHLWLSPMHINKKGQEGPTIGRDTVFDPGKVLESIAGKGASKQSLQLANDLMSTLDPGQTVLTLREQMKG